MRNLIFIVIILLSFIVEAQKKELRKIDKLVLESFYKEAKDELNNAKNLILSSDDKYKAQFYFYDARVSYELEDFDNAIISLEKLNNLNPKINLTTKLRDQYDILPNNLNVAIVTSAVNDNQAKNFSSASKKLFKAYEMDKEKYVDYLFYAAESSVEAQDLDTALKYYLTLKESGYTGIVDEYFVTDNETGVEKKLANKSEFDLLNGSKDYSNARIGQSESRLPGIVKNIAIIYVRKGEIEIAEKAIKDARELRPDDLGLLLTEGNVYLRISNETDDQEVRELYVEKFKNVMQNAIELDPENGLLYYNLGIVYSDRGKIDMAAENFKTAIDLGYNQAYLALAEVMLEEEKALVDMMNSLGNSKQDDIKYKELLQKKENVYYKVLPLLEESLISEPEDLRVLNLTKNIHGQLGDKDSFKKYSALIEEIESRQN